MPDLVQVPQFCDLLLSKQFSSKEKSMNLYQQKFGNPQHSKKWRELLTALPAKRRKTASLPVRLTNVVWRAFLNTGQHFARRVKHHQQDREDHALLGEDSPMGEGGDLEQKDL